jgi:hypothetical protein
MNYYTGWNKWKEVSTQKRKLATHWKYFTYENVILNTY